MVAGKRKNSSNEIGLENDEYMVTFLKSLIYTETLKALGKANYWTLNNPAFSNHIRPQYLITFLSKNHPNTSQYTIHRMLIYTG